MRQYRGMTKDGKWAYGWAIKTDFATYIVPAEYAVNWKIFIEVIPETVGQFTGLKDKNGVDIYEEDVMITHTGWKSVVKWNKERLCYEGLMAIWEVIGNIWEDKESTNDS